MRRLVEGRMTPAVIVDVAVGLSQLAPADVRRDNPALGASLTFGAVARIPPLPLALHDQRCHGNDDDVLIGYLPSRLTARI
jgi:hypothetical protein